jgi:Major capsid protein
MANAVPSRLGQINQAGDAKAIFLKVYAGEVLTAFEEANKFIPHHMVRTISNGKSASFPVIGKSGAAYHTPGTELVGSAISHAERVISIDELLVDDKFIANIDEAMNHYDVRSQYSTEQGRALAKSYDSNVAAVGCLAARAAATITGGNGGTVLINAAMNTDAAVITSAVWDAAQAFDEKDVPDEDRACFLRPAQYYLVNQNTTVLNKDFGGSGSYSEGGVLKVAGVSIIKTNHLPSTDLTADATVSPSAQASFVNTFGLVMQKSAVGTVKLLDLALEDDYMVNRQGTLMVAKYAVGHGILRPDCAVELRTL